MYTFKILRALGPIDAKSVQRDELLRWIIALPLFIALMLRWGLPIVLRRLVELIHVDLMAYYPLTASCILLMLTPFMAGMVIGFLLLDQRDDRTLTALQVTPMPLSSYLAYRLIMPMLFSVGLSLASFPIAGLMEIGVVPLLLAVLAAAPLAPLAALALAAFAQNKVQGFALTKASGVFLLAPLVAYFVPSGWQLAFGVVPTYWPAKLYWAAQSGDPLLWLYFLVGFGYQVLLLGLLLRRFGKIMHQ